MGTSLKFIALLIFLLPLLSCNDSQNNPSAQQDRIPSSKNETYTLDDLGISLVWTAYKFTDKIAVSGTFEDYTITKENESGSIERVLNKLKIAIPTECVDSGNAIRDFKLRSSFFEAFKTFSISGTVLNAEEGEGIIKLQMNNISLNTPYTYSLYNDTIVLFTHLDLKKWKGETALSGIKKECEAHLEGTDGISKLWPDVDVVVKLPVLKLH